MVRRSTGLGRALGMRFALAGGATLIAFALAVGVLLTALVTSSPRVASAAFITPPVFSAPIQAAGLTETWTINGWKGSAPNHLTSVSVTFPAGFVLPPTPTVTVTAANGLACAVRLPRATDQTVVAEISGACDTSSVGARQQVTVAGVMNPTTPGTMPAGGFKFATSVDGEMSATSPVVIWGMTPAPVMCGREGDQSTAQVQFTSTADAIAGNTGSGSSYPLSVSTSDGSFVRTPAPTGNLGFAPSIASGAKSGVATIAPAVTPGSGLVVVVMMPFGTGMATVSLRVSPVTGGAPILLATVPVSFSEGLCQPSTVTPPVAAAGSFSGGVIAPSGVSIVSFTGTAGQLNTTGAAAKLVSVTATVGGKALTFVVGAPDFVNTEFNAAFPNGLNGVLVIVKA